MRRLGSLIAAVLTTLALTAPGATAAQSAGWSCVANDVETDWTLLAAGGSFFPLPPSIPPEGPKVITGWKVTVGPGLAPIRQRLEVFEVQSEGVYKKIGESALETLVEGSNSFPTRIPVDEGDSVGLHGPEGTIFCDKEEGAVSLLHEGSAATGETKSFKAVTMLGTPVVATVEDDRDSDGFGDETQDGCPVSGAIQTACPSLSLSASGAVKRRAILVRVTTSNASSVQALGQTGWRVKRPGGVKARIVGLSGGPPRSLAAGVTTTFRLPLPKSILRRLDGLGPKQRLRVGLTLNVTDVFGASTQPRLVVRLRGRG